MNKTPKSVFSIPGTKHSSQNSQLLVSSGIPSLDELLGGGLPVGTVCLIDEDAHGLYSKVILKYFVAEGVVSQHPVFVGSQDIDPQSIVSELPAPIDSDPEPTKSYEESDPNKLRIAFRYQNLPTSEKESGDHFGHFYDLSKPMPEEHLRTADVVYWAAQEVDKGPDTFSNPAYHAILESIKKWTEKRRAKQKSVLRIALHSMGSPVWWPQRSSVLRINKSRDLDMFIFCLRALVRSARAVAVVSVPAHLFDSNSMGRCVHAADVAIKLQSFAGTDLDKNASLSDYHGFFHLTKLAAINSFASKHPGSVEYAFKLRRKKFCIEKLHLPPDVQDASKGDDKDAFVSMGCGSSSKHLLEF